MKTEQEIAGLYVQNEWLRQALRQIADFDHASECDSKAVPIYECCCFDKSQSDIAQEILVLIGDRKK